MRRKLFIMAMGCLAAFLVLGGCTRAKVALSRDAKMADIAPEDLVGFRIGVLISDGGPNDRSFNQLAWEGTQQFARRFPNVRIQQQLPSSDDEAKLLEAGRELVTVKSDVIIGVGAGFTKTIQALQQEFPDKYFILLGGEMAPADIGPKTVQLKFEDQEAAFLAGVAAALETQTQRLGFIGGDKVPAVERFGLGFLAGVEYAGRTYGTQARVESYAFQGTFHEQHKGLKLARKMYSEGIDVIFVAASAVGIGVLDEAMARLERGESVYVIPSDRDHFEDGKVVNGESVVLTSAIKHVGHGLYEILSDYAQGEFPGGTEIIKDLKGLAVGLPKDNPNLLELTKKRIDDTTRLIREGVISLPNEPEELAGILETKVYLHPYQ